MVVVEVDCAVVADTVTGTGFVSVDVGAGEVVVAVVAAVVVAVVVVACLFSQTLRFFVAVADDSI